VRTGKGAAQGYTDFYKRNAFTKPSGERKSITFPENKNPFEVSIKFGSGLTGYKQDVDDEDERKAALRRRLRKRRGK
jgi:hypothetical protein